VLGLKVQRINKTHFDWNIIQYTYRLRTTGIVWGGQDYSEGVQDVQKKRRGQRNFSCFSHSKLLSPLQTGEMTDENRLNGIISF